MEEEMFIAAQARKEEERNNKKGLKTGAKVALATVGVLAVLGGGIAATYFGLNAINDHKETTRAESLIASYMDTDKLVSFPESVIIDQAYDAEYCSGEKLVTELKDYVGYFKVGLQLFTACGFESVKLIKDFEHINRKLD